MKIQRLTVSNFMRVADLDLDLSGSAVHLFCGPNEAGKSTVAESVRFAVLGDTPRVALKKNYHLLVTRGQKKGSVTLTFDGTTIHRDVHSGEAKDKFKLEAETELSARIAFGAQGFVDLKPDERRALMFKLSQIKVTADDIVRRMIEDHDVPEATAARYRPSLAGGIESALKAAESDVSRLRAQWEQIAGEKYGSLKAVDWKPEFAPGAKRPIRTTDGDLELMRLKVSEVEASIEELTREIGAETANAARRADIERDIGRAREDVAALAAAESELTQVNARVEGLMGDVSTAQEMVANIKAAQAVLNCPSCDASLRLGETGELEYADPKTLNYSGESAEHWSAELTKARAKLVADQRRQAELVAKIERAKNSTQLLQDLTAKLDSLGGRSPARGDELVSARDAKRAALAQAQASVRKAIEDNQTLDHMENSAMAAREAQAKILAASLAVDALSPDGIKAELLESVLAPINARMQASAHLAGWLAPQLTEDMDLIREDGLPYSLLSESAQWRVSAVVADAIASMSGMRILILDRMDVLDVSARGALLAWAKHLTDTDFDTVLVMATLKSEPPASQGIAVHWLGEPAKAVA